jgi:hypothetical protein
LAICTTPTRPPRPGQGAASVKADPPSFPRGYAIRTAADAPAQEKEVRVLVSLGGVTAAGKFKLAVKAAEAKPEPKP